MNAGTATPLRIVVVEDSPVQRAALVRTLEAEGDLAVVGEAETATGAVEVVRQVRPDVVTLDLHIPEGGGQLAIERIMATTPTPILVLSATFNHRSSVTALRALEAGAIDAMPKPARWTAEAQATIRSAVRALRGAVATRTPASPALVTEHHALGGGPLKRVNHGYGPPIVAIGASTGGPAALAEIFSTLAGLHAPVLVAQHIHRDFVPGLVDWMARVSSLDVVVAENGTPLKAGTIYIGPGDVHLTIDCHRHIVLDAEPCTLHRPSADVLFRSVAAHAGSQALGVLLTGMGNDGAAGLLALRRAGAVTIAQDEASSAVFGMPGAAIALDAAQAVLPLPAIGSAIISAVAGWGR